jgi:hypothetical protein
MPAFRRFSQEVHKFDATLGYTENSKALELQGETLSLKKKKKRYL